MKTKPLTNGLRLSDVDPSMGEPRLYWGVKCRTCREAVAFGIRRDREFGNISAFLKPGRFRCVNGHTHTYHSEDSVFFRNEFEIPRDEIRKSRAAYKLVPAPAQTP
jgi:hypothetical protein